MRKRLVWFEIRTHNFIKMIEFYERVLGCEIEIRHLHKQRLALFEPDEAGMRGCIIENPKTEGSNNAVVLFYKVNDLNEHLKRVKEAGGEIVSEPFLVKQRDQNGRDIIGKNLFDDDVGYLAEVKDCDGNILFLYANS